MNCIQIGLPGKLILGDYFQENRTSQRPFLLLGITFPGRPIFIQFVPAAAVRVGREVSVRDEAARLGVARQVRVLVQREERVSAEGFQTIVTSKLQGASSIQL